MGRERGRHELSTVKAEGARERGVLPRSKVSITSSPPQHRHGRSSRDCSSDRSSALPSARFCGDIAARMMHALPRLPPHPPLRPAGQRRPSHHRPRPRTCRASRCGGSYSLSAAPHGLAPSGKGTANLDHRRVALSRRRSTRPQSPQMRLRTGAGRDHRLAISSSQGFQTPAMSPVEPSLMAGI